MDRYVLVSTCENKLFLVPSRLITTEDENKKMVPITKDDMDKNLWWLSGASSNRRVRIVDSDDDKDTLLKRNKGAKKRIISIKRMSFTPPSSSAMDKKAQLDEMKKLAGKEKKIARKLQGVSQKEAEEYYKNLIRPVSPTNINNKAVDKQSSMNNNRMSSSTPSLQPHTQDSSPIRSRQRLYTFTSRSPSLKSRNAYDNAGIRPGGSREGSLSKRSTRSRSPINSHRRTPYKPDENASTRAGGSSPVTLSKSSTSSQSPTNSHQRSPTPTPHNADENAGILAAGSREGPPSNRSTRSPRNTTNSHRHTPVRRSFSPDDRSRTPVRRPSHSSSVHSSQDVSKNQLMKKIDTLSREVLHLKKKLDDKEKGARDELTAPIKMPTLREDEKVEVLKGVMIPLDNYLSATHATSMKKRAYAIMRALWPIELRTRLVTKADKKRPTLRVVASPEYMKIIEICTSLQNVRKLGLMPDFNFDAVIKTWVSDFLKYEKTRNKTINNNNRNESSS